ncbi:class I SAM-dependent methyltransferase [Floridanema evergladense]|uniref:Class I SAM-dependent methyltransferase n=1 Tax=Floridaenema evergladense BLCC-F167 TaxID=3153639 RepID=A0ABV4WEY7_9CYAN
MRTLLQPVQHLIGQIIRGLSKVIVGPMIYGQKDDYDAQRYWRDRFSKYGDSLKGPGHEGMSEQENQKAYQTAAQIFINTCLNSGIDLANARILEIGCGTGFYTETLANLGAKNYLGLDITDVLFPKLKQKFPHFQFIKKDITTDAISGEFDLIVMIDVIEHIVKEEKLSFAMQTIKNCLSKEGIFLIAPLTEMKKRELFYVNFWSIEDLKLRFVNWNFGESIPFRNGLLFCIKPGQIELQLDQKTLPVKSQL